MTEFVNCYRCGDQTQGLYLEVRNGSIQVCASCVSKIRGAPA